jgi:hypothetical protein
VKKLKKPIILTLRRTFISFNVVVIMPIALNVTFSFNPVNLKKVIQFIDGTSKILILGDDMLMTVSIFQKVIFVPDIFLKRGNKK